MKKKNYPLMCFFGFRWCTIVAYVILWKPHVCENSDSPVESKNAIDQSDCMIFQTLISQKLFEV